MCGEPARSNDYEKTWQHSVVLTGLEPGEQYSYSVGDDPTEYSFKAAIPVGSPERMRFIMYGDMGVSRYHSAKAPGYVISDCFNLLPSCITDSLCGTGVHVHAYRTGIENGQLLRPSI